MSLTAFCRKHSQDHGEWRRAKSYPPQSLLEARKEEVGN